MNMGGLGGKIIKYIMNQKNVSTLEDLIMQEKLQGVTIIACIMSMDIMGIKYEELIDGVSILSKCGRTSRYKSVYLNSLKNPKLIAA